MRGQGLVMCTHHEDEDHWMEYAPRVTVEEWTLAGSTSGAAQK